MEAISCRGGNLLVSAAAGAGKTSVLVERIIRRITCRDNPVDVDRLLVVTFTNAAAAEVRERIGRALAGEIARHPGLNFLPKQQSLLGRACISTLHSFCLDLLRQHFYRIDLDPAFRVADETEATLIQAGALEELFEQHYAAGENPSFTVLVDCYGGKRDDAALQELVMEAYKFARSTPFPESWLQSLAGDYNLPEDASLDELPWCCILKRALAIELAGALAVLDLALKIACGPGGPEVYCSNLEADREMVSLLNQACAANTPWADLHTSFKQAGFGRLKRLKKGEAEQQLAEQVKNLRDTAKKKVNGLVKTYFTRQPEEIRADLRKVAPLIEEYAALVLGFGESYRKAKAARGVVDFSDLEHYALQILTEQGPQGPLPSPVALEMRQRFEEVLVDEYQDTSAVQEAILQMVSRQGEDRPNLFMVGDVKQSIYRFRLADPGLFLKKYTDYPTMRGGLERRLDLAKNFRSRRGIVNAVNFIFRQLMTPVVGEMAYDAGAELIYGAGYPLPDIGQGEHEDVVEIHLLEREQEDGASPGDEKLIEAENGEELEETEEELDAIQKEARLIARRIKELVVGVPGGEPGLTISDRKSGTRSLQYRDVVVLMRATAGCANTFVEEFRQEGVPVYAELATGYFEATEVETMLSLLKVIDNPRQDVPLAGVLRSPVAGLKAGDLAKIRLASRQGDYFDAVVAAALNGQDELSERLTEFLKKLERWRSVARQGSLADLIWTIYRETDYYDFTGGLPGGAQRQANLRALHHRAQQYEATAFRGLFLFLRFIERVREGGRDIGAARALSEKENVVRIMSIHKSKGLEFPVVFVAGLGKQFNLKDLRKDMLFHKDLGLGAQMVDDVTRVTFPTLAKLALKHTLKMEALAEEIRILYVAMTRAREKLILVGSARNLPGCARRWCGSMGVEGWTLPDGELAGASTCLGWLMPAIARHRDGKTIRTMGLCEDNPSETIASDSSRWDVRFSGIDAGAKAGVVITPEGFDAVRRMAPLQKEGPLAGVVRNRLDWRYPTAGTIGKAAKSTVTEMKRRFDPQAEGEEVSRDFRLPIGGRPLFMQGKRGLTAAERGTALHLVMQCLDLHGTLDYPGIKAQIEGMVGRELLTREQALSVPAGQIAAFFAGPLGKRVLSGRNVLRELPFTLALPGGEVYPELGEGAGEIVLVQGVVDCLVDEEEGCLLLDYKTDSVSQGGIKQVVDRYRTQMDLYARAVENILGRVVKEKYLYLFSLGEEIKL